MTLTLFAVILALTICGGYLSIRVCALPFLVDRLGLADAVQLPTAGMISIIFALFVAFGSSEMEQRSRELRLSVQREVSVARSIFVFAESVGASADPVRQALIEYLQAVTTREQAWLERSPGAESPTQPAADTLVQVVTLFVVQSPVSAPVKSLIISKVDELRQARTERIALSLRSSEIPQWIGLVTMAMLTQLVMALSYIGKPNAMRVSVGAFTAAAAAMMCYLAWIDGLIGPSKIAAAMLPLKGLLTAIVP